MINRFDHILKGTISLAVMLMFTVALIAAQARANLHDQGAPMTDEPVPSIVIDATLKHGVDSIPKILGTVLDLSHELDVCIDELVPGIVESGRSDVRFR